MKVVLDTNVLVSGIFFRGYPARLLDLWAGGRFTVYATPLILAEYFRVIDELAKKISGIAVTDWKSLLSEMCHIVAENTEHESVCRDPEDDKFIFCAMNSTAGFLVTGDMDLKVLARDFSFKIVSPREFAHQIPPPRA